MDQAEIDRILEGFEQMKTTLRESLELRNIGPDSRKEKTPPVGVTSQALTPAEVTRAQDVGAGTARPTAEEQQIIASGEGDWFNTFVASQNAAAERAEKLAWVAQVLPITSIDDLDFDALYQRIKQRGGEAGSLANPRNKAPDETDVEFRQRVVEEFLSQGANLLQRVVLEGWAVSEEIVPRLSKIDTPHGDVWSVEVDEILTRNPFLTLGEAEVVDLIGLAREHGVDPFAAAALYTTALQLGQIEGFRSGRQPTGTEARESPRGSEFQPYVPIAEGDLLADYKAGMDLYAGDAIYAQLHALDPDLAAKLWDPESSYTTVTRDEWVKVQGIVNGMDPNVAGWRSTTAAWMEKGWEGVAGDGTSGSGEPVNKGKVREDLRRLAQSWNLGNISDAELESLVGGFVSESLSRIRQQSPHPSDIIRAAEAGGSTEIIDTPSAQEYLRQTDRYKDLYGRKSAGESEEEYAFRFQSAAQGFLGDIGDNMGFEQAGMRTGDVQTTLGQAAISPEAAGSSTFLGRMATTANVVRGMT